MKCENFKKVQTNEYTFGEEDFRKILYIKKRFLITKNKSLSMDKFYI